MLTIGISRKSTPWMKVETVELCVSTDSADNKETGDTDDDFLPFRGNESEEPSTSMPKPRKLC